MIRDIHGETIMVNDIVKTLQPSGGMLPPAEPQTGKVETTRDAFNRPTLQIRYRQAGRDFDSFILLDGKINEIIR